MTSTENTHALNVARIARNAEYVRNGLMHDLRKRVEHPTYGVTKQSLRDQYQRLLGMLYAYYLVTGGQSVDLFSGAAQAGDELGINTNQLYAAVKGTK